MFSRVYLRIDGVVTLLQTKTIVILFFFRARQNLADIAEHMTPRTPSKHCSLIETIQKINCK